MSQESKELLNVYDKLTKPDFDFSNHALVRDIVKNIPDGVVVKIGYAKEVSSGVLGLEGGAGFFIDKGGRIVPYNAAALLLGPGVPVNVSAEIGFLKGTIEDARGFSVEAELSGLVGVGVSIPIKDGAFDASVDTSKAIKDIFERADGSAADILENAFDAFVEKAPSGTIIQGLIGNDVGFNGEVSYTTLWTDSTLAPLHIRHPGAYMSVREDVSFVTIYKADDFGNWTLVTKRSIPESHISNYDTAEEAFKREVSFFLEDGTQVFPDKGYKILPSGEIVDNKNEDGVYEFPLDKTDAEEEYQKELVIELAKTHCFLAGTKIDMWDGSQKPVEKIEKNDLVKSFDDQGNLVSGTVTQTMVNKADQILDFHGVKVTPGHAYLSGDDETKGQFLTIIDILRSDGAIVDTSGELIRAATNYPIGSREDKFIEVAYLQTKQDTQLKQGKIRAGTLLLMKDGTTASVLSCVEKAGYTLLDDGFVQKTGEDPEPLHWFGSLPKPEDYVLKRSQLTNEDVALVVH